MSLSETKEKYIYEIFWASVVLKALNGLLDVAAGLLLLSTGTMTKLIVFWTQKELIEDPHDFVANQLMHLLPLLSTPARLFGVVYLLINGGVKLILSVALLRGKFWAFPVSIIVLALFIAYQAYRFIFTHSLGLGLLAVFDLAVLVLIVHEYYYLMEHGHKFGFTTKEKASSAREKK